MKEEEKKKMKKSYFDVVGLCCSSEIPLIENILKPLEGIKEVSVIVPSRTVIVMHYPSVISQSQIGKSTLLLYLSLSQRLFSLSFLNLNLMDQITYTNTGVIESIQILNSWLWLEICFLFFAFPFQARDKMSQLM